MTGARSEARARSRGRGFWLGLALLCVAALAVRVGYVLIFRVDKEPFFGDSLYYRTVSNLLAHGHWFSGPGRVHGVLVERQDASHPPLYTIWLSIVPFFKGGNATDTIDMLWSCVLGTGSVALCGIAGREIAGKRVGLVAAAIAVVYPNMWVHDGMLLSETMAIFVSAGLILFAYRFVRAPTVWRAAWVGVWCGLATLARSELVLVVPLLLVPLTLSRRASWARRVQWLAAGGAALVVIVGPWLGYNLARFKEPIYLSTNFSGTISAANCDATYYGRDIGFKSYACGTAYELAAIRKHPDFDALDQSQQDALVRHETLQYVRQHVGRIPVVVLAREGRITGVFKPFQEVTADALLYRQERAVGYALVYSYWAVVLLAIAGSFVLRRAHAGVPVWPLWVIPVVVLVSVAVTFAQVRYRAPAEPALVLLAAVAIDGAVRRMKRGPARQEPVVPEPLRGAAADALPT